MKKILLSLDHKAATAIWLVALALALGITIWEYQQAPGSFPFITILVFIFVLLTSNYLYYLAGNFQYRKTVQAINHSFSNTEDLQTLTQVLQPRYLMPNTRVWAGSPDMIKVAVDMVLTQKPANVVEIGGGVSSIYLGYALEKNGAGHLTAIDHLEGFSKITRARLQRHGLDAVVDVVHAPLQQLELAGKAWQWYQTDQLDSLSEIDLLIVDGPPWMLQKMARYPALPVLFEQLAPNATIIVDDYIRPDEQAMVKQWMQEYPELELQVHPTEKGTAVLRRGRSEER